MDLRALSLFLLACLHRRQALAARAAGVSASTLSAAISGLEADLGIMLFRRGPQGLVPTDAGHWLFDRGSELLREAAACVAPEVPEHRLEIRSGLRLTLGRLSVAAVGAAQALPGTAPGWSARIRFRSAWAGEDVPGDAPDLVMDHAALGSDTPDCLLFDDAWVMVANRAGATLTSARLLLPPLPEAEENRIRQHLSANGVTPPPETLPEGGDPLDRLRRVTAPAMLIAPASLIADSLDRAGLAAEPLVPELATPVVARILTQAPERRQAAERFIALLRAAMARPLPPALPLPALRLADLHLLEVLAETGSLSSAARALHLTQPALSARLSLIEGLTGGPLFRRSHRGMAALPGMVARRPRLREALAGAEAIRRGARQIAALERQEVGLGISPMIAAWPAARAALASALTAWQKDFPQARLRLTQAEASTLAAELALGAPGLAVMEGVGRAMPGQDLANLGPLMRLSGPGDPPLAIPAPGSPLHDLLAAHPALREGGIAGLAPPLDLEMLRAGLVSLSLPERIAQALVMPGLTLRPLAPDTCLRLRLQVTLDRPPGPAEQALAGAIRESFRHLH